MATDGRSRAAVAWSSYGQDGELGEIFVRRYDGFLSPLHKEIKINEHSGGHQTDPRVVFDTEGNAVVAWRTEIDAETPARISFRVLSDHSTPLGPEIVVTASESPLRLAGLTIEPLGTVRLQWVERDLSGALRGTYSQRFDLSGRALGTPEQEFP